MSDLFGNHIVGFPTRRLTYYSLIKYHYDREIPFLGKFDSAIQPNDTTSTELGNNFIESEMIFTPSSSAIDQQA